MFWKPAECTRNKNVYTPSNNAKEQCATHAEILSASACNKSKNNRRERKRARLRSVKEREAGRNARKVHAPPLPRSAKKEVYAAYKRTGKTLVIGRQVNRSIPSHFSPALTFLPFFRPSRIFAARTLAFGQKHFYHSAGEEEPEVSSERRRRESRNTMRLRQRRVFSFLLRGLSPQCGCQRTVRVNMKTETGRVLKKKKKNKKKTFLDRNKQSRMRKKAEYEKNKKKTTITISFSLLISFYNWKVFFLPQECITWT